jgi:hypothetical protein
VPNLDAAPYAAGDSAGNIPLNYADKLVVTRWVAPWDGVVKSMLLRAKVEGSRTCPMYGNLPYAGGDTGRWLVTIDPVLADGAPDLTRSLAVDTFNPCRRQQGESVSVRLGLAVHRGEELATVVRNIDPDPQRNWASEDFLYSAQGVAGANGRNELTAHASNALDGLDPRELVGVSWDGGRSWQLPARRHHWLPTYVLEYADGPATGQAYYTAAPLHGLVTMVYPHIRSAWTIAGLGAYSTQQGSSEVVLSVNGIHRATVRLSGAGLLRATIPEVRAPAGSTVTVAATAGPGGLDLRALYGDAVWAAAMGFGTNYRYYLQSDPQRAAPVYPLPPLR